MSTTAEKQSGTIQIADDLIIPTRRVQSYSASEKPSGTSDLEQGTESPTQDTYLDFEAKKKQVR